MLKQTGLNFCRHVAVLALCVGSVVAHAQTSAPLVRSANLVYQGSFKVPDAAGMGFTYGGMGLTFNSSNNSLFMSGHPYEQRTGEMSIPAIGGTATLLQPLADPTGGRIGAIGSGGSSIGGHLVYKSRLYTTAYIGYDANGEQSTSHFSRPVTLSSGSATGPWRVGSLNPGFYSGYMGHIPAEWQARLGGPALTGNCCLSIITRTSFGPAAFAFDPENMTSHAKPLVYYPSDHPTLGNYGQSGSNPLFNGSTRVTGIVFPQGTASVLFFGTTGIGNYCYGDGAQCNDPVAGSKGDHAYPYRVYVWAYDANQLAQVVSGSKAPWSVVPYATWELAPFGSTWPGSIAGAAYDPATSRIFLSEKNRDGDKPIIHVYKVDNAAQVTVPQPPSAVTAQ